MNSYNIKELLKNSESLKQMFEVLNINFDTDKKLGAIAKGTIISKVELLINICGLKFRGK